MQWKIANIEFNHRPDLSWDWIELNGKWQCIGGLTIYLYKSAKLEQKLGASFEQLQMIAQFLTLLGEGQTWSAHNEERS